jgi:UDP-2-acetamido-3-amino-2,3-dideoxy-glucuronate N-acetyltransferase
MSEPRIGLVGAGNWGKNLLRNFHGLGALAAVCETSSAVRDQRRKEYPDVAFADSLEALLSDRTIGAVAVAVPAALHYEVCREALRADKHVFVEKPITLELLQAEELVRLASERKRVLMVGHILQYHPAILKIRDLLAESGTGRLLSIVSTRLNFGKIRSEENALWSLAPHDMSVLMMLTGESPSRVTGRGESWLQNGVEDIYRVDAEFPSGVRAHIHVSWFHPFKEQKLTVICENAMFVFDDTKSADKLIRVPVALDRTSGVLKALPVQSVPVPFEASEPLRNECLHFLECVRTGARPRTDGEEGLRVLRFLTAAAEQR